MMLLTEQNTQRHLVVALDVGTTYSGVSYCIYEPGERAVIRSVTRYPGQAQNSGSSKIPTVMYYDQAGKMKSAGAETTSTRVLDDAEDEGWIKVEWFKLRLCPESMPTKLRNASLPPLPKGKTVITLFADFFAYLFKCTEQFIQDTHPTLKATWNEWVKGAVFIIAHPNGWEGQQQTGLRNAAILGGLVPDTAEGRGRVIFVSEGEASLHYCIKGGFVDKSERAFIVADLGGGTLDFSSYRVTGTRPFRMKELDVSKCELEGAVIVTQRAHASLKKKLHGSRFGSGEQLELMTSKFDETTKQSFQSAEDNCHIQFGSLNENDLEYGIRRGRVRLTGSEVATFFEPSIISCVRAIESFVSKASLPISSIYLVGGFSSSEYLKSELTRRLAQHHISINLPDGLTVKAVPEGAISFYLDHHVHARKAKFSIGVKLDCTYDPNNPEHVRRKHLVKDKGFGDKVIPDGFMVLLKKGRTVDESMELRHALYYEVAPGDALRINDELFVYRGDGDPPYWFDEMADPGDIKQLCYVTAHIPKVPMEGPVFRDKNGKKYLQFFHDLVLYFGGPELKAQICWTEGGEEKRGPASIIYERSSETQFAGLT